MRARTIVIAAAGTTLLAVVVSSQGRGNANDWPTAYGDAQRSSWIRTDMNISIDSMSQPGFALQWKTNLDSPARQGVSLTQAVVTSGVNLFTPISTIAGSANVIFAVDNDTGNLFWTRRFDGSLGSGTVACPGGISGAPTRVVNLVAPPGAQGRGGAARGGRAYSGAVGEPGAGVPIPAPGARGAGGAARGRASGPEGGSVPAAPVPPQVGAPAPARGQQAGPAPSPFPTNPAAVAAAGGGGGGLFRSSGVIHAVSGDGMFRTLGLVSGKDVQRPVSFVPSGSRFSDLIAVGDMLYTATSRGCGGAPNAVWAISTSGDPNTVVSWKTNGGEPLGPVAFSSTGALIAAIGPGAVAPGGHANAIVALDPKTLVVKDWFTQPSVEFAVAPIVFQESGRDIVVAPTKDGRVLLLDAASLGGANHSTPLVASAPFVGGRAVLSNSPATWKERAAAGPGAAAGAPAVPPSTDIDGTRWLLIPVTGPLAGVPGAAMNGPISTGGMLAIKVDQQAGTFALQPGWVSENILAPLTPIVVNGVVFAAAGATNAPAKMYALNGTTGKTMWQSGSAMSGPASGRSFWAGSGHVFIGTVDGTVYAFGFDMERGAPDKRARLNISENDRALIR